MHNVKNLHEYTQIDLSTSQSFIVKKNTQILSGIETSTRYNIWQNKLHYHVLWGFFFIDKSVSQNIPYSQQSSVNPKSNNVLKFHPLCTSANGCAKYQHWPLRSMSTFEHHRWIIGTLEHWINGILEHWLRQISTLTSVSTLEHPPPLEHRNIGTLVAPNINSDTHVHIGTPTSWFKLKGKLNVYELSNSIHGFFNWHTFKCPQKLPYISLFNSKPYLWTMQQK